MQSENDELNFSKLFISLWREKFLILIISILSFFLSLYYVENIAVNKYTAKAIFGFDNDTRSSSLIKNIGNLAGGIGVKNDSDNNLLSEINGSEFLGKIVKDLRLIDNKIFLKNAPPQKNLILTTYKFLGIERNFKKLSEIEKIEVVVNKLRKKHLKIDSIETGGYEVIVTTSDPKVSSLIANTIAEDFIKLRLKNKIVKSDKALSYLSEKLALAKSNLEIATTEVENFKLERNVLSRLEFENQSNRLNEFRVSIAKLRENLKNLEKIYINLKNIKESNNLKIYINEIDKLYKIAPRLRVINNLSINKNIKKEIEFLIKNLPAEIKRNQDSIKITEAGFEELEKIAKETSVDAREFGSLQKNLNIAATRYEAMLNQFETQSIMDGFQEALGQIYEKSIPPIYPSAPNKKNFVLFYTFLGLILGISIAFIKSKLSNKIWTKSDFEGFLNIDNTIEFSRRSLNLRSTVSSFFFNKKNKILKNELIMIQGIIPKIVKLQKNNSNSKTIISCSSTGETAISTSIAIFVSHLISFERKKVLISDYSSKSEKNMKLLQKLGFKKDQNSTENLITLNNFISFLSTNKRNENDITISEKLESEINLIKEDYDIIIKVFDKIENEPLKIRETLNSDLFLLISIGNKISKNDLLRIRKAIGHNINNCILGLFVK